MNSLALEFYKIGTESNFQEVIFLSDQPNEAWEFLSEKIPDLPRGWFELSRVKTEERIEFIRDFWFDLLPFDPGPHEDLVDFFARLDDIALVLVRQNDWQPEMVYSLSDNSSFFRGLPPASEEDLQEFQREIELPLPRDYLSFLRIHNGFGKLSELGLLKVEDVGLARQRVKELLLKNERGIASQGRLIDPASLIPFYEQVGLSSFQCFYADWYPGNEMGNVFLSGIDYTISDTRGRAVNENLAFTTFTRWLVDYLEGMNLSF